MTAPIERMETGAIMVVRPVLDPTTGRTDTVQFHVEGWSDAPTEAELARLVGGPLTVIARAPSRDRPGVQLVAYAADVGAAGDASCVFVTERGQRVIVTGTLVILGRDATGAPCLLSPAEIVAIEYAKFATLPFPLIRLRSAWPEP